MPKEPTPAQVAGVEHDNFEAGGMRNVGEVAAGPESVGDHSSTARGSVAVAGWTLVSRATGLLRVLAVGALMGPTYLANVYQAGSMLPDYLFTTMAGPVLAMVMVPSLGRAIQDGGINLARTLLARVAGRLLAVAGLGGLGLAAASPLAAWTLVAGMPAPERGHAWLLASVLIVFVAPQVLLCGVGALGIAAQQARGRFAMAAAAPAAESIVIIITVAVACWLFGAGMETDRTSLGMVVLLGLGSTAAAALHAGLQVLGAAQANMLVLPSRGWRADPRARDAIRRIVRSIPVATVPAVTNYALSVMAATVPGGVLVVQLSYQVYYALSYLGARAVAIAALPQLSAAASIADPTRFARAWRRGLFYAVMASTPPMCLLVAYAKPTADLLANGQLRHPLLIAHLAACLTVAAVAQLVGGIHDLARQALFARLDDAGPRLASLLGLTVTVLIATGTALLPADNSRLPSLIIAILAGESIGAIIVLSRLHRAIRPESLTNWHYALTAAAAVLAMLPVIAAGQWLLNSIQIGRPATLGVLLGIGTFTVLACGVVMKLLTPTYSR